jgi:transcriptional regulator with PAS, ATPase and Fis domain
MKDIKTGVYTYNGEEKQFSFKTSLSVYDKARFVNIYESLILGDGTYYSIFEDLFFDFVIIDVFTDVNVFEDNKYSLGVIESLIEETEIVDIVKANVDYSIIVELKEAVDKNIEYKTGIHRNPLAPVIESLSNLLDTVEYKLSTIDVEGMMEFANVFSNMTGELTPEKMLDAYAKSDVFKNKYAEILKEKEKHNDKIEELVKDTNKPILH